VPHTDMWVNLPAPATALGLDAAYLVEEFLLSKHRLELPFVAYHRYLSTDKACVSGDSGRPVRFRIRESLDRRRRVGRYGRLATALALLSASTSLAIALTSTSYGVSAQRLLVASLGLLIGVVTGLLVAGVMGLWMKGSAKRRRRRLPVRVLNDALLDALESSALNPALHRRESQ
jgi:hypothetical protein